jgi:hypothetical protein
MDSGIYRLTYKTGQTYVGKSIHLNIRWRQHFDKLSKGKAAVNMQDAYYASDHQFPQTEVLLYCHPDMLDYYEGYFINYLKPELNTSIPDELPEHSKTIIVQHANQGLAGYSVVTMLEVASNFSEKIVDLESLMEAKQEQMEQLEYDYEELSQTWNNRARQDNWAKMDYRLAVERFAESEIDKEYFKQELETLQSWRLRVERASWWQRLWRSW